MEQVEHMPDVDVLAEVQRLQAVVAKMEARNTMLESATPLEPVTLEIRHRSFYDTIMALLTSRKFLLLFMDTVISLLHYYHYADPVIVTILQPVVLMLIYAIAKEDAAEKSSPRNVQVQEIHTPAGVETEISNS